MLQKQLSSRFDALMDYVEEKNQLSGGTSCALLVIQGDHIVAEHYRGTYTSETGSQETSSESQYNVASARKSYIGLATAWAVHTGAIASFDDPIAQYLTLTEAEQQAVSGVHIRHLLTHTHGLTREEGRLIRAHSPGTEWRYNNVGIEMLSTILAQVLGRSLVEWLNEVVFQPLNWRETGWRNTATEQLVPVANQQGIASIPLRPIADGSQGNLFVSARELAYWGYLHLKLGTVNGKTLLPESVIRTATSLQAPAELPSTYPLNGCLWFVKEGESAQCMLGDKVPYQSYGIVGFTGPLVLVVPELDLVVVRMNNHDGNYADEEGDHSHYLQQFTNLAVSYAR